MNYLMIITEDKGISTSLKAIFGEDYFIEDVQPECALKIISKRRPRVILLDSQFTGVNSVELLTELLVYDPTLTIIKLVSSFDKIARQSIELGAFEVVEKPLDIERLKHIIKRAIEREKLLKASEQNTPRNIEIPGIEENLYSELEKELFFQSLLKIVAENFSDINRAGLEILKIIKNKLQLNRMLILLKKGPSFIPLVSLGMGDEFNRMTFNQNHPLILWFLNKNRILNLSSENDISFECSGFMDTINCRIAFPLMTLKGELTGIFFAGDKITGGELAPREINFLNMVMDYLSMVFENASLYREISFRNEYQKAIFRNIPAGIIAVDKEGKIIIFNTYAEEISGIKFEDIKDEPIEKVGSQIADFIRRALNKGETFSRIEIDYVPGKIILGMSTNTISDESGSINGAVAIFQNLTAIKEIERKERTTERNRYWSSLASRLSHELKNPLVAINTFAQMLPSKYKEEEFRETFSKVVQTEIQRINEIIERINKIADTMELKVSSVDIVELFKNYIDEAYSRTNIRFNFTGEDKLLTQSDVDKIKEAIGYIMDFIYEDTGGNGTVYMTFRRDGESSIEVDISENGSRINLHNTEEIFVPFSPSVKSTISIGVMLAKKIFESHGGGLRCNLHPSGKNFIITLPVNISNSEKNLVL
ncbi:MAG: histidine kinase dimerization/phospho-acceptor domain-containing protein [Actinomycetota bacterium]|nr:histidine kinase dimerization/phospho-acceptor domain-containing protein [Actinomycetota bacterium]